MLQLCKLYKEELPTQVLLLLIRGESRWNDCRHARDESLLTFTFCPATPAFLLLLVVPFSWN